MDGLGAARVWNIAKAFKQEHAEDEAYEPDFSIAYVQVPNSIGTPSGSRKFKRVVPRKDIRSWHIDLALNAFWGERWQYSIVSFGAEASLGFSFGSCPKQ